MSAVSTVGRDDGDRRAAVEMHGLGREDRDWILGRLDAPERARLEKLLAELDGMDIRFDLESDQLSAALAGDAPSIPVGAPETVAEPAVAALRGASHNDMIRVLQREPQWMIERVLAIESWPWAPAVRSALEVPDRRAAGLRATAPAVSTASAPGPALKAALVELLAGRLHTAPEATPINGYRNGHDHALGPAGRSGSRWGRIVSGVRQWLP